MCKRCGKGVRRISIMASNPEISDNIDGVIIEVAVSGTKQTYTSVITGNTYIVGGEITELMVDAKDAEWLLGYKKNGKTRFKIKSFVRASPKIDATSTANDKSETVKKILDKFSEKVQDTSTKMIHVTNSEKDASVIKVEEEKPKRGRPKKQEKAEEQE